MKIEKGQILSEANFYTVEAQDSKKVILVADNGQKIEVSRQYADQMLSSAHDFAKEEKITKTELANIFISSSRVAMTVCFYKQVKETDVVKEISDAVASAKIAEIEKAIKKGVKKAIIGEERVMKGRHYGSMDEFGRINFVDMEIPKDTTKSYDVRMRLVDPRTISYLVVNNIKYSVK